MKKNIYILGPYYSESLFANPPMYSLKFTCNPEVTIFSVIYGHTQSDKKIELPQAHIPR